jgi:hypothetical protein
MSKPSMRVFRQWEGISLQQYYTAQDYEDERLERETAHEAMKGRLARESKLFVGMKPWRICECCGVWLLPGNETGRHLEADEVVQGLEQHRTKSELVKPWPKAVSISQIAWAKRQLQYLDAGGKVDQPREALVALAETDPTGLPERAADKKAVKPKSTPKRKAKEA